MYHRCEVSVRGTPIVLPLHTMYNAPNFSIVLESGAIAVLSYNIVDNFCQ
jgi:hypothetical protein